MAFKDTELIAILTDHKEFKYIDPEEVMKLVRKPVILDTKNCINKKKWINFGFDVLSISGSKSIWS
jgi:UDP-N-acetyl-D-mannosaminuronic acid dehydrogenase